MKHLFFTAILFLALTNLLYAQQIVYKQDFESSTPFAGFTLQNIDKATPSDTSWKPLAESAWIVRTITGTNNKAAIATSAYTTNATSDDWMITPAIRLGASSKLQFKYKSITDNKNDSLEVYVSTTEPSHGGCLFNPILKKIVSNHSSEFQEVNIDLASNGYTNRYIYLGFRLHTTSGDKIAIDDIVVTEEVTQFISLTFKVNMSYYIQSGKFNPKNDTVDIAGSFNNWDGTRNILSIFSPDSTIYATTINGFLDGDHVEFKFRINSTWHDSIVEFPYGQPNRVWDVEHGIYSYQCYYNNVGTPFSLPKLLSMSDIKVYPNPTTDWAVVTYPEGVNSITLLTTNGQKLYDISLNGKGTEFLNLSQLPASTYIALFYSRNSCLGSLKLIKR